MDDYSVYLHIPFCVHRCSYCDFNTYAGLESIITDYMLALEVEIEFLASCAGSRLPVHTIFFGGGTPSLLPAEGLESILGCLREAFELQPDLEVTLEANPGTLSRAYLRKLRELGVNRLSLGMQSAHPDDLRLLERTHSLDDVIQGVVWAREAGFENLNLDLIFGLPYQTLENWDRTLSMAFALRPEHFSLYALTLEHGTPMQSWVKRGLLPEPESDLAADMYEYASKRLKAAGYGQYEISNWARRDGRGRGKVCRHNLQYWRNRPYLGFGAGAHGYAGGLRIANVSSPQAYIQRCRKGVPRNFPCTPATVEVTQVDREAEIGETMMMGLRLTQEGVSDTVFKARFGLGLADAFEEQIRRLVEQGLLMWGGRGHDRLRLTRRGRLLGNRVFVEFI